MKIPTVSEELFTRLCSEHGIVPRKIPEGAGKTADYEIFLGATKVVVEVKQLDQIPPDAGRREKSARLIATTFGPLAERRAHNGRRGARD